MNKKVSLSIFSVIIILVLNFLVLRVAVSKEVNLVSVPTATRTILPRQQITEKDIEMIEVPKVSVHDEVIVDQEEIVGKYTSLAGMIPKQSFFYEEMLHKPEELQDYPSLLLKENEVSFSIPTSIIKLSGNTILPQQIVDILVTIKQRNEKPIVDTLFEGVRVVGIKDKKGLDIQDSESTGLPAVVLIAIHKEHLNILRTAQEMGEIEIYASSHGKDKNYVFNKKSKVLEYVE